MPLGIPHSRFLSWDPDDQDKALAWRRYQSELCTGCGTHPDEWDENPDAYFGDFYTCPGCERLEAERDNVPEGAKGVHYRLLTKEQTDRRIEELAAKEAERAARKKGRDGDA